MSIFHCLPDVCRSSDIIRFHGCRPYAALDGPATATASCPELNIDPQRGHRGIEIADSPQFWSTNGWWNVDGIFMKCWWNIHDMVMECGWNVGEMLVNMRSLPWFTMVYHWKIAAAARYQASLSLAAASVQLHLQWSGSHPRRRESWCGGIFGLAEMLIEFFQVPLCNMAPFEVDGFHLFQFSEVFVWIFHSNIPLFHPIFRSFCLDFF